MKRRSTNVTASLSADDLDVLSKFATNTFAEPATPADRVNEARATQALLRRGFLRKPKVGVLRRRDGRVRTDACAREYTRQDATRLLVTPEGLAALLDAVPVQRITPPSPRLGASTRLSTGSRT